MVDKESDKRGAESFLQKLSEVFLALGIEQSLEKYNINREEFTSDTLELSGALEQNPIQFGEPEINEVLDNLKA